MLAKTKDTLVKDGGRNERTQRWSGTQPFALRCGVYTRKSHEEGLDQSFNSLDAQTEACRAYILSQAGLGWQLRDGCYEDAGISGGHMDRPGLQALIADIEAGLIDVVVVYKVDRLTRSLPDFSRLVETFDKHDVSFVSVTQAFNTTTSMGRLTLNVLLSFAQFEREVTAERIRDKIAASKAKGMWMGGLLPLGYRSEDRKLVIDEREVKTVRLIFSLYQRYQNVRLVKRELDSRGAVTKQRVTKAEKVTGGKTFSRGHIHRILTNPVYIGKIVHKGTVHDGLHEPIIGQTVWDDVQAILDGNTAKRSTSRNAKSPSFLAGLLEDEDGHPLVTHHTKTRGKQYRYYVSRDLKAGETDSGWRIPSKRIELLVRSVLQEHLRTDKKVITLFGLQQEDAQAIQAWFASANGLAECIERAGEGDRNQLLRSLLNRVVVSKTGLMLRLNNKAIAEHTSPCSRRMDVEARELCIQVSFTIRRRGQEMRLVVGAEEQPESRPDDALILLVARATLLREQLETGAISSIGEFAEAQGMHHADAKKLVPLGYLTPSIVEDILAGRQPIEMTARTLHRMTDLPICWRQQRARLGFL